jgi:hypothetical protein
MAGRPMAGRPMAGRPMAGRPMAGGPDTAFLGGSKNVTMKKIRFQIFR